MKALKADPTHQLICRVMKFSATDLVTKDRILYVDKDQIKYYKYDSRILNQSKESVLFFLPKAGIPTKIVTFSSVPNEWKLQKGFNFAIKVVFIKSSQIVYQRVNKEIEMFNTKNEPINNMLNHITSIKSIPQKKKVEWIFDFYTFVDLHEFVNLVESITDPDNKFKLDKELSPSQATNNEFSYSIEYPGKEEDLDMRNSKSKRQEKTSPLSPYKIRGEGDLMKLRKQEAINLEGSGDFQTQGLFKAKEKIKKELKEKLVELSWKINFQNYFLSQIQDNTFETATEYGLKMVHLLSEFKKRAKIYVKEVIDELCFPANFRGHQQNSNPSFTRVQMGKNGFRSSYFYRDSRYTTYVNHYYKRTKNRNAQDFNPVDEWGSSGIENEDLIQCQDVSLCFNILIPISV